MTIPRIARIHLIYQSLIITLLFFAIGYNEILPDKKYLFLALIPVFCYQLMIVFCCTELLPLPSWINVHENTCETAKDKEISLDAKGQTSDGNFEPVQQRIGSPEPIVLKKLSPFKYSFKNRKMDGQEVSACGKEVPNNIFASEIYPRQDELKTTKSYYFPHRQKRLEEWIEQKETVRPYKVRSFKPGNESKNSKSLPNQESPSVQVRHAEEQKSPKPMEYGNKNQTRENDSPDLKKSYSFPFRHKKLEKFLECEENLEDELNIPVMPPWKALNSSKSVNSYKGRRKSVSTEALHEELELVKSCCQQKDKNDFSQSMELTGTLSLDACAVKKNPLKSATSFNKFKQGIVNCFNKTKRESFKSDETKQNAENRKTFFRELYLSKESLNFDEVLKEESTKQMNSIKTENRSRVGELFQTSYVSFASDSFTDDVKVFSHPKNLKK